MTLRVSPLADYWIYNMLCLGIGLTQDGTDCRACVFFQHCGIAMFTEINAMCM